MFLNNIPCSTFTEKTNLHFSHLYFLEISKIWTSPLLMTVPEI